MDTVGNPDRVAYLTLYPYLNGNLLHIEVTFDTTNGIEEIDRSIDYVIGLLQTEFKQ